jgi:hypothetical protein
LLFQAVGVVYFDKVNACLLKQIGFVGEGALIVAGLMLAYSSN